MNGHKFYSKKYDLTGRGTNGELLTVTATKNTFGVKVTGQINGKTVRHFNAESSSLQKLADECMMSLEASTDTPILSSGLEVCEITGRVK